MKIIIIGSGASGLAAGISLLRCGYDVTILERFHPLLVGMKSKEKG